MKKMTGWVGLVVLVMACQPITEDELQSVASRSDPLVTTTGAMATSRRYAAWAALPGGKVLAAGGWDASSVLLATAERYDRATGLFSPAGTMSTPRATAAAVPLLNGKVLVVGGLPANGIETASAELYDPTTNTWGSTSTMTWARGTPCAVRLNDGRVLVMGGLAGLNTAEVYNPATNSWALVSPIGSGGRCSLTLLADGRVLLSHVFQSNAAFIFSPTTNTWSTAANSLTTRSDGQTWRLNDGRVLVAGGRNASYQSDLTAEIYNPATNSWAMTGSMLGSHASARGTSVGTAVPLLVDGGDGSIFSPHTIEAYSVATGTWSIVGNLASLYRDHGVVNLDANTVLIAGSSYNLTAEIYSQPAPCVPTTCAQQGKNCGSTTNGCDSVKIDCGTCATGQTCTSPAQTCCQPASGPGGGGACGQMPDGCGGVLAFPQCPSGQSCGGENQCLSACSHDVCTTGAPMPSTCSLCAATVCARQPSCCAVGPGGKIGSWTSTCVALARQYCGACNAACVPQTCLGLSAQCGQVSDGCGGTLSCGLCASGHACGTNNRCQ